MVIIVFDKFGSKHSLDEKEILGCRDLNIQDGKIHFGGREEGFYILCHEFGAVAMVYASHLQEALDIAADEEKIDCFKLDEKDLKDYSENDHIDYLGNFSDPYDMSELTVFMFDFDNPKNAEVLDKIKKANEDGKEFWEVE